MFSRKKKKISEEMTEDPSMDDFELQQIEIERELQKQAKREETRRQLRKFKNCCKSAWTFMFSHIGLSGLVVGYSIMGGFLFRALEAPNEKLMKVSFRAERNNTISEIVRQALYFEQQVSIERNKLNFSMELDRILREYQKFVYNAVKNKGWDGEDDDTELKWSYAGALLFAVTVITTIGYGHVAPKTKTGRIVTILYALIGIPLTFLCLANIGDFLANCFRMLYAKVCCGLCCIFFQTPKHKRRRRVVTEDAENPIVENDVKGKGKKSKKSKKDKKEKVKDGDGKLKHKTKTLQKEDSNRESTLTETSLLDNCGEDIIENATELSDLFYRYDDLIYNDISLEDTKILLKDEDILISVNELFNAKETDITNGTAAATEAEVEVEATVEDTAEADAARRARVRRSRSTRRKRNRRKDKRWKSDTEAMFATSGGEDSVSGGGSGSAKSKNRNLEKVGTLKHTKSLELVEVEHKAHKHQKVRVPISLCLLLIAGYIFVGALLFGRWENWDYLTGSYFCFVTLSTIGFGDIVPGTKLDSWASQEKLVACALYLGIGLSVLAMCFNLMQEEVKEKCRWVGRKVGILSDPD